MSILAFTGFCRFTARPSNCEASSSSRRKDRMENAGEIRRIARYESQRALVIESLETIEQLPGDFQVRLHSQPHQYQFIHFFWRANGECCRSDAGERKIRLQL